MVVTGNNTVLTLPAAWREVTLRQLCEIEKLGLETAESRASYFAGREIKVSEAITNALAYLENEPPTEGGMLHTAFDFGQYSFLQVELVRAAISTKPAHEYLPEVFSLATARATGTWDPEWAANLAARCLDWPITEVYPVIAHCIKELQRLSVKYAYLAEPDHTEAGERARAAGAERLNAFGHLNTARHYATVFSKSIDEIYMRPWEEIALMLYQDRITSEVQDAIHKNTSRE